MPKHIHEIRDPIHVFIRLDSEERKVLDSRPVQRLRHIHQLAMTNLIYPGATHRRFEHSLSVMELAGLVSGRYRALLATNRAFPCPSPLRKTTTGLGPWSKLSSGAETLNCQAIERRHWSSAQPRSPFPFPKAFRSIKFMMRIGGLDRVRDQRS
jgi:hypothetical protein